MSWLARARKLKGVTAKDLSEAIGFSLNYVQQIESGRRAMSEEASERIRQYLGFDENNLPLDSRPLIKKINDLEANAGSNAFCLCKIDKSGGLGYITDVIEPYAKGDLSCPPDGWEPIRLRYARNNVEAQMILIEKPYDD